MTKHHEACGGEHKLRYFLVNQSIRLCETFLDSSIDLAANALINLLSKRIQRVFAFFIESSLNLPPMLKAA
jgi:hypothetical protein